MLRFTFEPMKRYKEEKPYENPRATNGEREGSILLVENNATESRGNLRDAAGGNILVLPHFPPSAAPLLPTL